MEREYPKCNCHPVRGVHAIFCQHNPVNFVPNNWPCVFGHKEPVAMCSCCGVRELTPLEKLRSTTGGAQ